MTRLDRGAIARVFVLIGAGLGSAATARGQSAQYVGTIGQGLRVQARIDVSGGDLITGWYAYEKTGGELALIGMIGGSGRVGLTETENGKETGQFDGAFMAGGVLTGTWSSPDGKNVLPFRWTKAADYVTLESKQPGVMHVRRTYPKLTASTHLAAVVNDAFERQVRATFNAALAEAKTAREPGASWEYEDTTDWRIAFCSDELVSVLAQSYAFTGGAHGNHGFASTTWWVDHGRVKEAKLADVFAPKSDYVSRLSRPILKELRTQQAQWVLDGQIKGFAGNDLACFEVLPHGLRFTFAPYAVGPYAEGAHHVTVPWATMADVLNPDGPARVFSPGKAPARPGQPSATSGR